MALNNTQWLDAFLEKEKLPDAFRSIATDYYAGLAEQVHQWMEVTDEPFILGVNGGQGTGKSTLSEFIALYLKMEHGLATCIISIDDLYLDREKRNDLATEVHPLLVTRGVPGTHDVAHGISLLTQLKAGELPLIPRFNKATDQPFPEDEWLAPEKPPRLIILEGWCVGAMPQSERELEIPINQLEKTEDPDGSWRAYVNAQLAETYDPLFQLLDRLVMLKTPSFEMVHEWRSEQEAKLASKLAETGAPADCVLTPDEITRFISHYERLTRWMIEDIPQRADFTFHLNADHGIDSLTQSAPTS